MNFSTGKLNDLRRQRLCRIIHRAANGRSLTTRRAQMLQDYLSRKELPPMTRLKAASALVQWNAKAALPPIRALIDSSSEPRTFKMQLASLIDRQS